MSSTENFPKMYKRNRAGKVLEWSMRLDSDVEFKVGSGDLFPCITRMSGQIGGKIQTKKQFVKKGTNAGKANAKSVWEHALFTCNNMFQEKIEENFVDSLDKLDLPPTYHYPMLAKPFNKKKTNPPLPAFAQPKLNGIRTWQPRHMEETALTVRDITPESMLSRKMFIMTAIHHIKKELAMFGIHSPDGEVYSHGIPLQTIQSWSKKDYGPEKTGSLEYWVYDLAVPGMPFNERSEMIASIVPPDHDIIKVVPTIPITSRMEFFQLHDKWFLKGYEGAMWRSHNGLYGFNERPDDLYKFKNFDDKEFRVTGWETEDYHDQRTDTVWELVVWECETDGGERFNVRPVGSMASRRVDIFDPNKGIGKWYNVRYQELSESGVPTMLTGRGFRDKKLW